MTTPGGESTCRRHCEERSDAAISQSTGDNPPMPKQHRITPLEEALEAWRDTRAGVIAEAENITSKGFHFRPAPESRTVAALLRHIMEVGMMGAGELSRPDTDFHRAPWPALLALYD